MTTTPTVFEPDPETAERLLHDLGNPNDSLAAIALAYGASLDSLSAWMARPDIADRLATIESAAAQRARLAALLQLPKTVAVLRDMIEGYHYQETHDPIQNDLRQTRAREIQRENARKAIHLLKSITSLLPAGSRAPRPRAQPPHEPVTHPASHPTSHRADAPQPPTPADSPALADQAASADPRTGREAQHAPSRAQCAGAHNNGHAREADVPGRSRNQGH